MRIVIAFAAGIVLSYFHWLGLIAGGAAVGFAAKSTRQALVLGFIFGLSVWILFLAVNSAIAPKILGMGALAAMSFLLTIVLSTSSAALRSFI